MMTQYDLSVDGYGDDTRGRRMKCGLFVTFVMAMCPKCSPECFHESSDFYCTSCSAGDIEKLMAMSKNFSFFGVS